MQQTNTKYCRSRPYRNRRAQKGTSRCLTWAGVGRLSVSASATMRCVRRGVSLTIPARTRSRTKNRRMSMCREKNLRKTSHNQNRQDFQTYRYKRDCLADWHDWLRDARARKTCGTKDNFRFGKTRARKTISGWPEIVFRWPEIVFRARVFRQPEIVFRARLAP